MSTRYMFDMNDVEESIDLGQEVYLLRLVDGYDHEPEDWLVQHVCREWVEAGETQQIVMAPPLGEGHKLYWEKDGTISVSPSVRCGACTLHGWVVRGVWFPAKYKRKIFGRQQYVYKDVTTGAYVSKRYAVRHPLLTKREPLS